MKVFEIKINGRWVKVQSEGMISINNYCEKNDINDWRMVGMQSRSEMIENKKLPVCN